MNVVNFKLKPRLCKHVGKAMGAVYNYTLATIPDEQDRIDTEYDTAIKLLARLGHTLEDPTEFIADMNSHLRESMDSFNGKRN
jgi:hypothetical protein